MSILSAGTSNTTSFIYTGDTTGAMVFQTNGTTEAMRITAGQNVGIGTTTPTSKLEVNRGSAGYLATFTDGVSTNFAINTSGTVCYAGTDAGSTSLALKTTGVERMRITSDGDVGIGTSSPLTSPVVTISNASTVGTDGDGGGNGLCVIGTTGAGAGAQIVAIGSDTAAIDKGGAIAFAGKWNTANDNFAQWAKIVGYKENSTNNDFSGYLGFYTRPNNQSVFERMRITSSGDLLVGKTTTSFSTAGLAIQSDGALLSVKSHGDSGGAQIYTNRLGVNGPAIYFYKDTNNVGNISVTGSATSYNSGSDYRLKNNIQPITNALQKVALLKPSKWIWKADNTYGDGFVAHELAEVFPHAVTGEKDAVNEDGSINPQGVDTSFLVATLTAAIQEQQAQIEELKAKVLALEGNN